MRRRTRLSLLLVCLGLASFGLITSRSSIFSAANGESQKAHWCVPGGLPQLATVGLDHLARLRTALLPVMEPIGTRRYAWGSIGPENMWSDNAPQKIASARVGAGRWLAGFEMRTWAGDGDDIAASVLEFVTPEEAGGFFEQASGTRCHRAGKATVPASPPRARNLVWINPDGPTEEDVFLLRGRRVYRLVDVRSSSATESPMSEQQTGLSIVNHLACSLPNAGCRRPTS
jgi:hypothetical protein